MSGLWICMSAAIVVEEEACEREGRLGICKKSSDEVEGEKVDELEVEEMEEVEGGGEEDSLRTQATEKGWFIHQERAGK